MPAISAVTVLNSATTDLLAAVTNRNRLVDVHNGGANAIYVDIDADVTDATSGMPIAAGATQRFAVMAGERMEAWSATGDQASALTRVAEVG